MMFLVSDLGEFTQEMAETMLLYSHTLHEFGTQLAQDKLVVNIFTSRTTVPRSYRPCPACPCSVQNHGNSQFHSEI